MKERRQSQWIDKTVYKIPLMKRILYCLWLLIFSLSIFGCELSPKILLDNEIISKDVFYIGHNMRFIQGIDSFDTDKDGVDEYAIFSSDQLHIVNNDGKLIKKINFEVTMYGVSAPSIIMRENGKFLVHIGGSPEDVSILDQDGKIFWRYQMESGDFINGVTYGDLNQDGENEFYVTSFKNLVQLNSNGELTWERENDFILYEIELYQSKVSTESFLVSKSGDSGLIFWDDQGNIVREINDVYVSTYSLCSWPKPGYIILENETITIIDQFGKQVFDYRTKWWDRQSAIYEIRGVPVDFHNNQRPYLAVLAKLSSSMGLSVLYIFSPEGKLIYNERLKVTLGILPATLPGHNGDVLLVGEGPGRVNKYFIR